MFVLAEVYCRIDSLVLNIALWRSRFCSEITSIHTSLSLAVYTARSCAFRDRLRLICSMFTLGKLAISVLVVVQLPPNYPKSGACNIPRSVAVGFSSSFASKHLYGLPHPAVSWLSESVTQLLQDILETLCGDMSEFQALKTSND